MAQDGNFIEVLRQKEKNMINEYEAYVKDYEFKLTSLRTTIALFEGNYNKFTVVAEDKKVASNKPSLRGEKPTKLKLAKEAIMSKGMFLHKNEISDLVGEEIGSYILSSAKFDPKENIVSYSENNQKNRTYWGFKEWLDDNGEVKPAYKHRDTTGSELSMFT